MLSQKTLKKLQLEQLKLDQFIIQKKNLTDADDKKSFIRAKIALLVEIGELANELKTFKHWKSQKEVNWEKAKEELIDCLHFYLSWANSLEIDFSDYKFQKLVPEPDFNELLLALFSETEKFSLSVPWNKMKRQMLATFEKSWIEGLKSSEEIVYEGKIVSIDKNKPYPKDATGQGNTAWVIKVEPEIPDKIDIKSKGRDKIYYAFDHYSCYGGINIQEGKKYKFLIQKSRGWWQLEGHKIIPWETVEEVQKNIEKISNSFLSEIEVEKNKASFYRWLIIFEELAQKMGMENEKNIEEAYLKKNKINWKRQKENY